MLQFNVTSTIMLGHRLRGCTFVNPALGQPYNNHIYMVILWLNVLLPSQQKTLNQYYANIVVTST